MPTVVNRKVTVPDADEMDDATFILHFNKRHKDSLGGLAGLLPSIQPYVLSLYRAFHRRLHAIRIDLDHEHIPGE